MARTAALLAVCLALASVACAQNVCLTLGGPLLGICKPELDYLSAGAYPLNSPAIPDDGQVKNIIKGLPSGLPSNDCCKQAQQFDTNKCACDNTLSSLLSSFGIPISEPGLKGVVKITSTACNYTTVPC